jgi:hypothetical protein
MSSADLAEVRTSGSCTIPRPGPRFKDVTRRRRSLQEAEAMGTSDRPSKLFRAGHEKSARDQRSMRRTQPVSIFSCGWMRGRTALLTFAVLGLLAAPGTSPAQDAGVSGIPPGPANARGLNGSVNDPSGIGNAARVPALPSPTITPVTPPSVSSAGGYRSLPVQRAVKIRRTRFAAFRYRRGAARAAVKQQDRLIDRKVLSICKGC